MFGVSGQESGITEMCRVGKHFGGRASEGKQEVLGDWWRGKEGQRMVLGAAAQKVAAGNWQLHAVAARLAGRGRLATTE